jgi:S1-C subfamily serine protease
MRRSLLLSVLALAPAAAFAGPGAHSAHFRDFRFGHAFWGAPIGLEVFEPSGELRKHLGAPEDQGLLVNRVLPQSRAESAGIRVGDVITKANGRPARRVRDLRRADRGQEIKLEVVRDRKSVTLTVAAAPRQRGRGFDFDFDRFTDPDLRGELRDLRERVRKLEKEMEKRK